MSAYGGVEVYLHSFITSALDHRWLPVSRPECFTPADSTQDTHYMGGRIGPTADLDCLEKNILPIPGIEPSQGQYISSGLWAGRPLPWPHWTTS